MTLEEALAERVRSLAQTNERLRALDDQTDGHVVPQADADAVMTRALAVLATSDGLAAARRVMRDEDATDCDELARAGLAAWDPASGSLRPTALLVELMKVVDR